MHEWVLLGVVAAALYLIECCAWIGASCWACFRHPLHGRWRAAAAADLIGNDRGGILLSTPFDLSGAAVQSCEWPVTVDPGGVVNARLTDRDGHDPEFIAFDDVDSVRAVLDTVLVNERPFVKVPSVILAVELADLLQGFASARRREREKLINAAIKDRLNIADVKQRWRSFHDQTRALRLASLLSALWLFVAVPVVLLLFGPLSSWPFLLAGVLLGAAITATLYFRAHQRLFTIAASERWVHAVSMTLFPPAAFRACDRLAKELMWRFEPMAVVAAFCDVAASASLVRPAVFDLVKAPAPVPSSDAMSCRAWQHQALNREVAGMLRPLGVDLQAAPDPEDVSMRAFCPRCHAQYAEGPVECAACDAVALVPFAAHDRQAVMS